MVDIPSDNIVHPSDIEKALAKIWDDLQGKGKMRACLFNLIIFSPKNLRTDYLYRVMENLIEKFPSRVLFVTIDEKAPKNTLKTSVSAISASDKDNSLACDLINILLSKDMLDRASFLILPHLLPDLPVYLLRGDDPSAKCPFASQLKKLATRTIYDSESTVELSEFAQYLLDTKSETDSDVADLNWARIGGWRQLFFDTFKCQSRLDELQKASKIVIKYNSHKTSYITKTIIQALYLQGWLASQLDWKIKDHSQSGKTLTINYQNGSNTTEVQLLADPQKELPSGRILALELTTHDKSSYHFYRAKEPFHVVNLEYSTENFCQLPHQYIFDKFESGQSLIQEIFKRGTSKHYLNLLSYLAGLKIKVT